MAQKKPKKGVKKMANGNDELEDKESGGLEPETEPAETGPEKPEEPATPESQLDRLEDQLEKLKAKLFDHGIHF